MYVYIQIAIWWLDPPNTPNIIINQKRGLNNMDKIIEHNVNDIVDTILNDYTHDRSIDKMKLFTQPDRFVIIKIIDNLMKIMYPGYFRDTSHKIYIMENSTRVLIEDTLFRLNKQIELALKYSPDYENADDCELHVEAQRLTVAFFHTLPKIRALLETDLQAAFDGDPAAYSKEEVILSYPGLQAITINRLAHELFQLKVPLIPRIMTEYAHSTTVLISTRAQPSANISSSITEPASLSAKRPPSARMSRFIRVLPSVLFPPAAVRSCRVRSVTLRSATM